MFGFNKDELGDVLRLRIQSEVARVDRLGLPFERVGLLEWRGTVPGRGKWSRQPLAFTVTLTPLYPSRAPIVRVLTALDPPHPNISPSGYVCINHFLFGWRPTFNFATIWEDLGTILEQPNYRKGFVPDAYVQSYHGPVPLGSAEGTPAWMNAAFARLGRRP